MKGELKFIAQLAQQLSDLKIVAPQIYTQANTIVETMLSVREQASVFVRTIQDDTGRRLISIIVGALILPDVMEGKAEASTTRKPCTPCTRKRASTTEDFASGPIRHVQDG